MISVLSVLVIERFLSILTGLISFPFLSLKESSRSTGLNTEECPEESSGSSTALSTTYLPSVPILYKATLSVPSYQPLLLSNVLPHTSLIPAGIFKLLSEPLASG